jgi:hypothetical protein
MAGMTNAVFYFSNSKGGIMEDESRLNFQMTLVDKLKGWASLIGSTQAGEIASDEDKATSHTAADHRDYQLICEKASMSDAAKLFKDMQKHCQSWRQAHKKLYNQLCQVRKQLNKLNQAKINYIFTNHQTDRDWLRYTELSDFNKQDSKEQFIANDNNQKHVETLIDDIAHQLQNIEQAKSSISQCFNHFGQLCRANHCFTNANDVAIQTQLKIAELESSIAHNRSRIDETQKHLAAPSFQFAQNLMPMHQLIDDNTIYNYLSLISLGGLPALDALTSAIWKVIEAMQGVCNCIDKFLFHHVYEKQIDDLINQNQFHQAMIDDLQNIYQSYNDHSIDQQCFAETINNVHQRLEEKITVGSGCEDNEPAYVEPEICVYDDQYSGLHRHSLFYNSSSEWRLLDDNKLTNKQRQTLNLSCE